MRCSVILGTVLKAKPNRKVKKSDMHQALILSSPRLHRRISVFILNLIILRLFC